MKHLPIVTPAVVTTTGETVALDFPAGITAVEFGQGFKIPAIPSGLLGSTTGTETVTVVVDDTSYILVDSLGKIVTSQMLRRAVANSHELIAPFMVVQFGASGAEPVFYARRGFNPRKTTAAVVTVP